MSGVRIFLLFVLTIFVNACTSVKEVPVKEVHTEQVVMTEIERDSIYIRDSIFVQAVADTVFYTRVQWRYRDRILRDTVRIVRCDTVPSIVRVERELTRMEKVKMDAGGAALWIFGIAAVVVAVWVIKKLKGI